MTRSLVSVLLLVVVLASSAFAQGILVPKDTTLPPLAIKSQQVQIDIENQVATTTVKQVFINSTNRQLEANYVFPMPAEATIRDFAMTVDGKRVSGELVEAVKAREIYTRIVAQAKDPGLLEHLGDNLFRVNIFPVPANGTQTVELSFSQVVPGSGGVFRYTYPLKTGSKASQVQDFFSIGAKLTSKTPIKTIYSPSHDIGVSRKGDHDAVVGLEQNKVYLDKDFSLYWTVSEKDFGLNAVAYRPSPDQPGYLMLLLSPKSAVNADEIVAKDVIFVFDTSGSMSGEKIEQAKKALKFCVDNLNGKDRFAIITFSTDVTTYKDGLIEASKEHKEAVRDFINRLQAEGGTNIHDALEKALAIAKLPPPPGGGRGEGTAASDATRPKVIVFMTDGRPTIGKTGTEEILGVLGGKNDADNQGAIKELETRREKMVREWTGNMPIEQHSAYKELTDSIIAIKEKSKRADGMARIFTFGVGDDVNTKLLDQVANKTGGQPEYVRPGEDLEVKVSDFFAKASHPVMTGLSLAFGGDIKVEQMFPKSLPDLYFGQQVIAFARYTGAGDTSVTLAGTVSTGKTEKHVYEVALPKQTTDNNFIEPLWAHRKVGYLLDQIRLNGENKEVKEEVIRLSKQYKIQTPYTSYLVLEEQHRKQYLADPVASSGSASHGSVQGGQGGGRFDGGHVDGRWGAQKNRGQAPAGETTARPSPTPAEPGVNSVMPLAPPADRQLSADEKKDFDKLNEVMREARNKGARGVRDEEYADMARPGRPLAGPAASQPDNYARRTGGKYGYDGLNADDLKAESGEAAVTLAKEIANMKRADTVGGDTLGRSRQAAGRTFYALNGFWVDDKFQVPAKMTFVKFGSEAYFAIVAGHIELKDALALGQRVIVVTAEGKALVISDASGVEKMTEQEIGELFTK